MSPSTPVQHPPLPRPDAGPEAAIAAETERVRLRAERLGATAEQLALAAALVRVLTRGAARRARP